MKIRDENASIVPVYLSMLFILLIAACAIVYLGGAYTMRTTINNDLALTRQAVMNPAFALPYKNTNNPGRLLTRTISKTLNKNGTYGDLTVWFYEAPKSDTGDKHRVIAWTAQVKETYTPPVAMPSITVAGDITDSYLAYSGSTTWRPSGFPDGMCYKYTTNTQNPTEYIAEQKMRLNDMPSSLQKTVSNRLDEIATDF